jgi:hypothetical protein
MNPQTNRVVNIQSRIARSRERIAKWDKEAAEVEPSWLGGLDYTRFCQGMARTAREKREELEAELKGLQGGKSM